MKSAEHSQTPNYIFNGIFDDHTRQALKEKRRSVGVSLQQLGDFLEIHWSTVRKWEAGITMSCHPRHVARITKFLTGDYDDSLRALSDPEYGREQNPSSHFPAKATLSSSPYCSPRLETFLEHTIEKVVHETLEKIRKQSLK